MYTTKGKHTKGNDSSRPMLFLRHADAQAPANPSQNANGDTQTDTQSAAQSAPQSSTQGAPMQGVTRDAPTNRRIIWPRTRTDKDSGAADQADPGRPRPADPELARPEQAQQDRREKMRAIQQDSKGKIEAVLE